MQESDTPEIVETCCVCAGTENVMVCGGCKSTRYCSKACQKVHRPHHAVYCAHIKELAAIEKSKLYGKETVHQRQDDLLYLLCFYVDASKYSDTQLGE